MISILRSPRTKRAMVPPRDKECQPLPQDRVAKSRDYSRMGRGGIFRRFVRVSTLLTEKEIARSWASLFNGQDDIDHAVLDKAEGLLDELRPESPLRHRLDAELVELRQRAVS
ncbi:MAG: hypothetical protein N2C12_12880 [Planctomycetales bacterium]